MEEHKDELRLPPFSFDGDKDTFADLAIFHLVNHDTGRHLEGAFFNGPYYRGRLFKSRLLPFGFKEEHLPCMMMAGQRQGKWARS